MSYNIRKNWLASFDLMVTKPIILLPFFIVAFLEGLALEVIYYFPRRPLADIFTPIIRRFFGPAYLHYPQNLILLPELFHYAQIAIYIVFGIFLAAASVNIFKELKNNRLPQTATVVKNACSRYIAFFIFGVIVFCLISLLKRADTFVYGKAFSRIMELVSVELNLERVSQLLLKFSPFVFTSFLFISNIILQTFLVLTVPLMIIEEKSFIRALFRSIAQGARHFLTIFKLIFLPFSVYLPIILLKTDSVRLINKTFPEINLYILILGIFLAVFVECFVIVSASQFVLDNKK